MNVGINCLHIYPSFVGGVTTYALGLLEGFAKVGNGARFQIYATQHNHHLFDHFRTHDNFDVIVVGDRLSSLRTQLCRATLLSFSSTFYRFANDFSFKNIQEVMESESDLIYTPTVVLPCFTFRKPTVLSMHDIQHVHHPEFFTWQQRVSRRITYGLSAQHATYFQASSRYIKEDLLSHFSSLTPEQVEVIPSGVQIERFAEPAAAKSLAERYRLPERFLFYPAQLWPHKNHITILKALKHIEAEHHVKIPLVLTGAPYAAATQVFAFMAAQSMDYVRHLGTVPPEDMVALYQQAAFMITATLHESSSLPVLEAAASGTAIIGSRIPPIEELGQVLQLNLFDPLNSEQLAELIRELWNNQNIAASQAAYNRAHIGNYSWTNTACKYMHLFQRIASD